MTIKAKHLPDGAVRRRARGHVRIDLLTSREIGKVISNPYIGLPDFQARGRFMGVRWRLHNNTNRPVLPAEAFAYHVAVTDGHDVWSVWTHAEKYPFNAPSIMAAYNYNEGEAELDTHVPPGGSAAMWVVFQVPTAVQPTGLLADIKGLRRAVIPLPPSDGQEPADVQTPQVAEQTPPQVSEPDPPEVVVPGAPADVAGDCPFATTQQPSWVVFHEITDSWNVAICQTSDGGYLYHGESHDDPSNAITLPASAVGDGYEATNRSYTYRITADKLQVWHGSELLVEEWFILGE